MQFLAIEPPETVGRLTRGIVQGPAYRAPGRCIQHLNRIARASRWTVKFTRDDGRRAVAQFTHH